MAFVRARLRLEGGALPSGKAQRTPPFLVQTAAIANGLKMLVVVVVVLLLLGV